MKNKRTTLKIEQKLNTQGLNLKDIKNINRREGKRRFFTLAQFNTYSI